VSKPLRRAALAIDHGSKRSGFALADALRITTAPLAPYHGPGDSPELLRAIDAILRERDVDTFLVGWPLNMDGGVGARAQAVQAFVDALRARFPKHRIIRYDERLTTKAAEELLRDADVPIAKRRELRDSFSALVLLRDWIASGEPDDAQSPA